MKTDTFIKKFITDIENKNVPRKLTELVKKITVEAHMQERSVSDFTLTDYRKLLSPGELSLLKQNYQTKKGKQTILNI